MSSFQQLSDLKAVKKTFAEQAKRRAQEEEKAREREREENFFRHAMKDLGVTPLEKTDANRVSHNIKKPVRIPMAKDVERAEVLRATTGASFTAKASRPACRANSTAANSRSRRTSTCTA